MLSPGKHSTRDIPRMVAEAAAAFPTVHHRVTEPFGLHDKLAEVICERAGMIRGAMGEAGSKESASARTSAADPRAEARLTAP
jgi:sirohydrochlorin ferrochelatase